MIRYPPAALPPLRALASLTSGPLKSRNSEFWRLAASASDGIYEILLSLRTTGCVLIPAYTCSRVARAVLAAGDTPLFIDVDPSTGNLNDDQLRHALRDGAKAVILTHLFGWNIQFDAHCRLAADEGVMVIEDSALVVTGWEFRRKIPSVSVASFGRGKPLSLGGGGIIRVADETLQNLHDQWLAKADRRTLFTYGDLLRGALRDSWVGLRIGKAAVCLRAWAGEVGQARQDDDFTPRRLSGKASCCIEQRLLRSSAREIADETHAALTNYRNAFAATGSEIAEALGFRLPKGLGAPAVALRCNPTDRQTVLTELASQWIDCPRYWQYCLGEDMSGRRFPGARQLADSLLFLPLHGGVDPAGARKVVRSLQQHRLHAFN